jgi:hypothetical protein
MRSGSRPRSLSSISGASPVARGHGARDNREVIDDPNFSLELDDSWARVPIDDPQLHGFVNKARTIGIVVSGTSVDVAPEQMDQAARMLIDMRIKGEHERASAAGTRALIYEPIVVPRPWGRAAVFYGHDDKGRQFSFSAWVTRHCTISLYGSSDSLSQSELFDALDAIAEKIEFDRPALDADMPLH